MKPAKCHLAPAVSAAAVFVAFSLVALGGEHSVYREDFDRYGDYVASFNKGARIAGVAEDAELPAPGPLRGAQGLLQDRHASGVRHLRRLLPLPDELPDDLRLRPLADNWTTNEVCNTKSPMQLPNMRPLFSGAMNGLNTFTMSRCRKENFEPLEPGEEERIRLLENITWQKTVSEVDLSAIISSLHSAKDFIAEKGLKNRRSCKLGAEPQATFSK